MRDSDPFWNFVILGFLIGALGTVLLFGLWEVLKWGARAVDCIDLARSLRRPRSLQAGRSHR